MSSRLGPGSSREPAWHGVTALFGGTFDPPHSGHREAVRGLLTEPGVGAVRVLPSPSPPHKPAMATAADRAEMTRLCFAGLPAGRVAIDHREMERAARQPGRPTYTFDTLQELRPEFPDLAFVIGTDQLLKLPTWHRFPEVLGLSHWLVLDRKGPSSQLAKADWPRVLAEWQGSGLLRSDGNGFRITAGGGTSFLKIVGTTAPALSSTQIRETLARSGNPDTGTLPPDVEAYLMKHRLYGTRRNDP